MLRRQSQSGFTLIEMIVSLALFSVVVTIAVGALLILIASNRQLQNEQSILSNLSFALDSMTREIRTGTNYYCMSGITDSWGPPNQKIFASNNPNLPMDEKIVGNCITGKIDGRPLHGLAFDEGGRSVTDGAANRRISYFFNQNDGKLYRRLSGFAPESIVSDGIYIAHAEFFVTATNKLFANNEDKQAKVTIFIEAYASEADFLADENDESGSREFSHKIQTTITQRTLDI